MSTSGMFADLPVDVGLAHEGERVRKPQMHVELGGPNVKEKFELLRVKGPEEVEDGKITLVGPDVPDLEEGGSFPFGIYIEVSGEKLEVEMEGVMERRIHDFCNYIEGFMHLNQRDSIWLRLDKTAVKKGLNLEVIGKALQRLFKSEMAIIEKIQITFITDPKEVKKKFQEALEIYEGRDARARGMTDDDVDVFYGCTLCQSFAPSHICVISAQRYANCGAISWFDGRAAAKVDPKGPVFEIPKGECLDDWKGEYEGINKIVSEKSLGEINRVQLYTAFGYPHTSCGCFEITTFYVPECDGLGVVHRDFRGQTPSGLTFGGIADSTGGGRQVDGFHGISFEYMRSPKFLQVDGGWNRIIWLPSEVKEKLKDYIPAELYDKIATENDAADIIALKEFLREKGHPVVERWVEAPPEVIEAQALEVMPVGTISGTPSGGITIILKNAKIHAEKVIIKKAK
ncbi:MAG: CO dehydrogenase/CO-methylating acetyl-CoA synthase complex subunit beta [Methanocellales archaeon]|nr:CO dehydrogenase/CO-methylating acetyl-CoA synthase complex subunit beta [Methanocellales archaeon]MDD3292265.1 CO dehydrogenase/CO-methylating acetyl-CoA synthase complex subunit beta [Methanocellales archaeon]MDD5485849.1 CO dehydrogenase/CO-methylating acetyl-CoA synthase complex subunit beta [Methanocellales archaeon]